MSRPERIRLWSMRVPELSWWGWLLCGGAGISASVWLWIAMWRARQFRMADDHRLDAPTSLPNEAAHDNAGAAPSSSLAPPPCSVGKSVSDQPPDDQLPYVVIICPGRNEADHIGKTLPEMCRQDYPNYHVIFVDDESDDATPALTADLAGRFDNLTIIRNDTPPPAGWVGKCWAVKRGYDVLHDMLRTPDDAPFRTLDLALFTDADMHWHPLCLRMAVNEMRRRDVDVMSLFPSMTTGTTGERLVLSTLLVALCVLFPFEKAVDPKHPDTLVAGAFILVRRELYDRIGGHEAVASCVVEDVNLGRALKAAGGRVGIAATQTLLHGRMYEGWSDLWEGLTKNAYAGMEYRLLNAVGFVSLVLIANVLTPVYAIVSILWWLAVGGLAPLVPAGLSGLALLCQARGMNRARLQLQLPFRYTWSTPIGSALYMAIGIASVVRYYRGGNVWKGRSYGQEMAG
ncbi:MAG: glycosyltransferase family 2 protein [Phycisphaeraceae bacterium]|jgi:chlorobactene glucosyltransferase|nr:glycosyltransferase family 2 protein [Phycisphaeraceae bacterium]